MWASGMLTKIAILSLIMLAQGILLRSWAEWVIFRDVLCFYFHESTNLTTFTKKDLSRTKNRNRFSYFLEVLKFEIQSKSM